MPEQSLRAKAARRCAGNAPLPAASACAAQHLIGGTAAMTLAATWMMLMVMWDGGISILEGYFAGALLRLLFAWIAMVWAGALAGFISVVVFGRGRKLGIDPDAPLPVLHSRTALLMPTYNEDPRRLLAGLQAIFESVAATGQIKHFDFFILSDYTPGRTSARPRNASTARCANAPATAAASTTAGAPTTPGARPATSPTGCAASAAATRRC